MTPSALLKPSVSSMVMRGVVLLCLLELAFSQAPDFNWNGPSTITETAGVDPSTEEVCLMDQTLCGCCLMQQKIHRMKMFFSTSLSELEKELIKTRTILNHFRASRSVFSIALTNDDKLTCFGPKLDDELITYKHVFINLGDGYSVNTGIFTVPRSGLYSLALTIYGDADASGKGLAACASLQVNGQMVAEAREKNTQDEEDSATAVVAFHLNAGDKVAVNLPAGCFLCDDSSHYNTFSGFLLYATD